MPFSDRKCYFAKLILNQTVLIPLFFFLCAIALPSAFAGTVNLAWDPSTGPNIAGYKMHYGTASKSYSYNVNVGKSTSCSLSGLTSGKKYYFAATAYNSNNVESSYSTEISYTVPTATTNDPPPTNPSTNVTTDYNSSSTVFAFEAEEGDKSSPMVAATDSKSSSGKYIWAPNGSGGYSQYTFKVTSAGNYIVWGRVLAPDGDSDSFFVSMDGKADSLWDVAPSSSWTWDKVNHRGGADPVVYNLNSGTHTLLIKQRENGTKLDGIVITKDMNTTPSSISTASTPSSNTGTAPTSGSTNTTNPSNLTVDYNSSSTIFAFEAEEGDVSNSMVTGGDSKSSSGTYIWAPNGSDGYSQYTFNVTSAGNYIVWGRVLAPDGGSDSFFVSMDGKADSLWDVTPSSSWTWDKVNNRNGADPVVYYLDAKTHTLRIKQRENGTKLDGIVITKDMNTTPSSISTASTPSSNSGTTSVATLESVNAEIEAEDGTMSKSMERASDNSASSGMYVWVPEGGGSGGTATFTFDASRDGNYIIWARVLAPNGSSDSFFVSMDGKADSLWDVAPSSSWTWDKVNNRDGADPVVYYLKKGTHTLLIKQREDGAKLDEFIITDDLNLKP